MSLNTIKIFLASSSQLQEDREQFEIFIGRENKRLVTQGTFLELVIWEDFLDAMGPDGLQAEYNKAIRNADIFVMLYFTKVGKYTAEEFEAALGAFKAGGKPLIFTYFKDASINTGSASKDELMSLWAFQDKLKELGHYQTVYKSIEDLLLNFKGQLDRLLDRRESQTRSLQADETGKGISFSRDSAGKLNLKIPKNALDLDKYAVRSLSPRGVAKMGEGPSSGSSLGLDVLPQNGNLSKEEIDALLSDDLPSHGVVLYSIPSKMQLRNSHRCIVRIAVDKEALLLDLPELASNPVVKEQVRISTEMEVAIAPSPHFEITPIEDQPRQVIEKDSATEWNFDIRPLSLGKFPLNLKISIVLPNGMKHAVVTESIQVVTEAVAEGMEFVAADLNFTTAPANSPATPDTHPPVSRSKILFVAASPDDQVKLQVEKEYRLIRAEMERGSHREQYEFLQPQFGVTIGELIRSMSDKPQIVHFTGHGGLTGLLIATEEGKSQPMPDAAMKRLFRPLQGVTKVILLNACYSATQAQEISKFGMYVVGNNRSITEEVALAFVKGLYIGLGEGKSFEDAYNDAMIFVITMDETLADCLEVWKDGNKVAL